MSACSEQWPPGSWQTLCTVCACRLLCTTGTHHVLCHSFALLVTCSSGLPARSKPPAPHNGSVCYSLYEDEVAARERLAECELRWRAAGLPPQLGLALVNSARASEKKSQWLFFSDKANGGRALTPCWRAAWRRAVAHGPVAPQRAQVIPSPR